MDDLRLIAELNHEPPADPAELAPARERLLAAARAERTGTHPTELPDGLPAGIHAAGTRAAGLPAEAPGGAESPHWAGAPLAHPEPAHRRRWRPLAAAAALTGAVAAGITALLVLGPTAPIGGPPGSTADAQQILRRAASAAAHQPDLHPRPGQFVYIDTRSPQGRSQQWASVDGSRDGWIDRTEGDHFVLPGCRDGRQPLRDKQDRIVPGQFQDCTAVPAFRPGLPTTAEGMYAFLLRETGVTPAEVATPSGVNRLGKEIFELLETSYVQPKSLSALFQAANRIPGMGVVPDAVDAAGRHGIGVGWTYTGGRLTMIFDSTTYTYLGSAYAEPGHGPAPTSAVLRIAVVDKVRQLPR